MSTKIKSSNIESGAINDSNLSDGSVSSAKLASVSVTKDKLHTNIIPNQTALSSADVDAVNDYLLIYDASATALKKIAVENIKPDLGAIDQHIIPDTNITYDLGSSTHRFRDLYLSGSTINLGGTKLSRNSDGNVEFKDDNDALKRIVVEELQIGEGLNSMRVKREEVNGKAQIKFEEWDTRNPNAAVKKSDDVQPAVYLGENDTDDLDEGSSNLYFTNSRAREAITGTGLINVASNGTISFQGDTDGISEGSSNLYFTNSRAQTQARRAITVTGDATYSNVTGALNVSAPVRSVNGDTGAVSISSLDQDFWSLYMAESDLPTAGSANHGMIVHVHETGDLQFAHNNEWHRVANKADTNLLNTRLNELELNDLADVEVSSPIDGDMIVWDDTDSEWQRAGTFTSNADTWLATKNTGELSEGSNQYFTTARARSSISGSDPISYSSSTGVVSWSGDTDDVPEGANKYFTDTRARGAISVGGDLSYDEDTGVISYSFTERTDDEVKGIVGGMITGNTETGISVTYQSTDKTLDFEVDTTTIATRQFVSDEITKVVGSAPDALNTLQELATALQDNDSDISAINTALGNRLQLSGGTLTGALNGTVFHASSYLEAPTWKDSTTLKITNTSQTDRTVRFGTFSDDSASYFGPLNDAASDEKIDLGTSDGRWRNASFSGTVTANAFSGNASSASRLSTARTITLSGEATGSATFDGSGNINIAVDVIGGSASSAGNADTLDNINSTQFLRSDIADSFSNTLTYTGSGTAINTAGDNIDMGTYRLIGSNGSGGWASKPGVHFDAPGEFRLHASNGDVSFYVDGEMFAGAGGIANKVFHNGYHPNADKWTTARTLSLTGDATGSVSWDGSANASITVTVDGNNHSHDYVATGSRLTGNGSNVSVTSVRLWDVSTASDDPTGSIDGILTTGMWDSTAHGVQQYHDLHTNTLSIRRKHSNTWYSWDKVWTSGNDGAGSGLDADTLDGYHASHFATAAGSLTYTEGTTAPSAVNGSFWYNTSNGKTYMKQQNIWKQVAPGVGGTAVYDVNGNKVS